MWICATFIKLWFIVYTLYIYIGYCNYTNKYVLVLILSDRRNHMHARL